MRTLETVISLIAEYGSWNSRQKLRKKPFTPRVYESLTQNNLLDCRLWYQSQLRLDKMPLNLAGRDPNLPKKNTKAIQLYEGKKWRPQVNRLKLHRAIYENAVIEIWGCCTILVVGYCRGLLTVLHMFAYPGLLVRLLNSSDFQEQFNASFVINLDLS